MNIERTLRGPEYVEILEDVVLPSVNRLFGEDEVLNVIEDNSTVHRSDVVNDWYAEHPRFNRLKLPPKSPDINVIENVWAEMVRTWRPQIGETQAQLIERVQEFWESMRDKPEYFRKLTDSVPDRLDQIILHKGGVVNY